MYNKYEVRGDITVIFIVRKNGEKVETIISTSDLTKANSYKGTWGATFSKSTNSFYINGKIAKTTIPLHRFLLNPDKAMVIDHFNHDTLNNTRDNLKIKTHSGNMQNRKGAASNNKIGIRGVCWCETSKSWIAQVRVKGVTVFRKYFKDINDAETAVINAREKFMTA